VADQNYAQNSKWKPIGKSFFGGTSRREENIQTWSVKSTTELISGLQSSGM
jgi:hypothetical protein